MSFLDDMLNNKISKEASETLIGKDAKETFDRKVEAHPWVESILELDPVKVEAEYQDKLNQEAKLLGKTASQEFKTPEEVVESDYDRQVKSYSDSNLTEMLALARAYQDNVTQEKFSEYKEKAKKDVESSRESSEKELIKLTGEHTLLDWKKAFETFSKDAKVEQPTEKELYGPEVTDKEHNFNKPSEDKFKMPTEKEMVPEGNGREADQRTEVTKEAVPVVKEAAMAPEAIEDVASVEKDAAPNIQVIDSFISGSGGASSANLHIVKGPRGMVLVNYETPIAFRSANGELFMNSDKYSPTTSKIQSAIRNAAGGQIKEMPAADLEKVMSEPVTASAASTSPLKREELPVTASMGCPACGGEGMPHEAEQGHLSCMACGTCYASSEPSIQSHASKTDVIKKIAEIQSPWIVTKDEQGNEVIARVEQPTNEKISEENKEDLQK